MVSFSNYFKICKNSDQSSHWTPLMVHLCRQFLVRSSPCFLKVLLGMGFHFLKLELNLVLWNSSSGPTSIAEDSFRANNSFEILIRYIILPREKFKFRRKKFKMRVLALISGGKDSIFAMHVVHASGHDIVVLGHISPSQGIHGQQHVDTWATGIWKLAGWDSADSPLTPDQVKMSQIQKCINQLHQKVSISRMDSLGLSFLLKL